MAGALPPAQYSPALHAVQTGGLSVVPGAVCTVPAEQTLCDTHCVAFTDVE
jgi:hypothetical protein